MLKKILLQMMEEFHGEHVRYSVESNVTMSMNNIIITMNQSYIPVYL